MSQQVYLMKNSLGLYKVGISNNPAKRCKSLANTSGFPVSLIKAWNAVDARSTEKKVHNHYTEYRKNGEWFDFDSLQLQDVFACVQSYGGLDDIPPPPIRIKRIDVPPEKFKPPCWRNLCKLELSTQRVPQTVEEIRTRIELQGEILRELVKESKLELRALAYILGNLGYNLPYIWRVGSEYYPQGVYDLDRQANSLQRAMPIHKYRKEELLIKKVYVLNWLNSLRADMELQYNKLGEIDAELYNLGTNIRPQLVTAFPQTQSLAA